MHEAKDDIGVLGYCLADDLKLVLERLIKW